MNEIFEVFSKASMFIPMMIALGKLAQIAVLPKKWTPLWNIVIGVTLSIIYVYPQDLKISIMVGLMLGLSASGLYSGVKNTAQAIKGKKA